MRYVFIATLEGIGLSANDDYSIVSEAFPYLSQRLLTDESPRAKAALRSMVYGTSEESAVNEKTPSLSKLVSIGEGFTSYSSATSSAVSVTWASFAIYDAGGPTIWLRGESPRSPPKKAKLKKT